MKLLHVMLRVSNLEQTIAFYRDIFNMRVLRKTEYPAGRFTLVFMGYGDEKDHTVLEFTYNWDTSEYNLGTGYGHIAIGVPNVYEACDNIRKQGGVITREPGPMKHGQSILAFVEDPDGYKIELLQR